MGILFYGIATFLLAFIVHLAIWKIHFPKSNQTITLLKIFFGIFIISIIIFKLIPDSAIFGISFPQLFSEYLQFFLMYSSLTLGYLTSYSAIEVDSPSLIMILNVAKGASSGFDKKKLYSIMTDDFLIKPRVMDLFNDRMIYKDKDKFKLTPKGIFFVDIFIFFRKLLNATRGG